MTTQDAQAQQQACGDGYPFPYTTAQGFAGERRCELQTGHDGYHLWQQCQWPPAQQQTGADELAAEPRHFDGYRGLSSRTRHYWPDAVVLGVGEGRFSPGPLFDMGWNARQPEVDQLRAQVATAEAERGEERRNASRLFDELRADLAQRAELLGDRVRELAKACEQRDQLRAQVEAMRATLEDFANPDHWVRDDNEQWIWHGCYPPFERPALNLLARLDDRCTECEAGVCHGHMCDGPEGCRCAQPSTPTTQDAG